MTAQSGPSTTIRKGKRVKVIDRQVGTMVVDWLSCGHVLAFGKKRGLPKTRTCRCPHNGKEPE